MIINEGDINFPLWLTTQIRLKSNFRHESSSANNNNVPHPPTKLDSFEKDQ